MKPETEQRCKQLSEILGVYSDCGNCGKVIKDPSLLVPDPYNKGQFKSTCSSCHHEASRYPFPPNGLNTVFEMLLESAKLNKPILVLVLSCTVYEVLFNGLLMRLFEKKFTPPDVSDAAMDVTNQWQKERMIDWLTGKKISQLMNSYGYNELMKNYQDIKGRRNGFLHGGIVHKYISRKIEIPGTKMKMKTSDKAELDENDIDLALSFTIDIIHCFAKIYSQFGAYEYIDEGDY